MKKKTWFIIGGVFVVLLTVTWLAGVYLKHKLQSQVAQDCPGCAFKLDSLRINPITRSVTANSLEFHNDLSNLEDHAGFELNANKIKIHFDWGGFFGGKFKIPLLEISDFGVIITESRLTKPTAKVRQKSPSLKQVESSYGGRWLESLPEAVIRSTTLTNGDFRYKLRKSRGVAEIHISDIQAKVSEIGTRKEISPRFTDWELTGQLEKSGQVKIFSKVDLFSVKNHDHIEIELKKFSLAEMNKFFEIESGMKLKGYVEWAVASVDLKQGYLTGTLKTRYSNLDFTYHRTKESNWLETAVKNVAQSMVVAKSKPVQTVSPPVAKVAYQRKRDETLISFLLEGLKKAAIVAISK